jgi:mannose-1-phosphate guanylyltransferase
VVKGFVLAAGFGERLRPLTTAMPKPMLPVLNVPSLCFALMLLKEAGVTDIIINLHYLPEQIVSFMKENGGFGFNVEYSFEKTILGTGGGVKKCESLLRGGDFFVVNSDQLSDLHLAELYEAHRRSGAPATVVLVPPPDASHKGDAVVKDGRVLDFRNFLGTGEPPDLIYPGIAALSPPVLDYLVPEFSSIVYTGYTDLIQKHTLPYFRYDGFWMDIGTVEALHRANMLLIDRPGLFAGRMRETIGLELCAVSPGVHIGRNVRMERSVAGNGAVIGDGAVVRNSVVLPGATVKAGSVVENAVVLGEMVIDEQTGI